MTISLLYKILYYKLMNKATKFDTFVTKIMNKYSLQISEDSLIEMKNIGITVQRTKPTIVNNRQACVTLYYRSALFMLATRTHNLLTNKQNGNKYNCYRLLCA